MEVEILNADVIETSLQKANITQQVLNELKTYSSLTINGVDDNQGYQTVKSAVSKCRNTRTLAVKICKSGRDESNRISKAWIEKEKEVVGQIEEVESVLKQRIESIDAEIENQRQIKLRRGQLPLRQEQLKAINMELTEDEILSYSDESWYVWMLEQKTRIADIREAKLKAAEEALQREMDAAAEANAKAQAEIERQKELQEVAERAAAKAKQDAEEEYNKKIRDEQLKAIKEREEFEQKIMMEAKAKEDAEIADRIAQEEKKRQEYLAPDKDKLTHLQSIFECLDFPPPCVSLEGQKVYEQVAEMTTRIIQFIEIKKQKL